MSKNTGLFGCGALLALLAIGSCAAIMKDNHEQSQIVTISSKERQCDSAGKSVDCYYVVFGTKGEVFENRDSLLRGKFDSASIQARLMPGRTYRIVSVGWRSPLFSVKPNIVQAVEADSAITVPIQ